MNDITFWGWDKKSRTMLRYLKAGDIFCFKISDDKFGFGRIVAKVSIGHSAEIFGCVSSSPNERDKIDCSLKSESIPVILDSYSLFDKKISGEWRVIGHEEVREIKSFDDIYFVYGPVGERKKVDMFGNTSSISEKDYDTYPAYMPKNDFHIKNMLSQLDEK